MSKIAAFKKFLSLFLRIGVSIVLLVLLFKFNNINLADLFEDIKNTNKVFLLAGFVTLFFGYLLGFLRWKILLKAANMHIPTARLVTSFSGGAFFNTFLPSTIGGDVVKAADLAGHTNKAKEVIATVFLDRLSGYVGLVLVILPALLLHEEFLHDKVVISSVGVIVIVLIAILLILFNKRVYSLITRFLTSPGAGKVKEIIKNLHHEIHIFRERKRVIVSSLILSFLIQLIVPLSTYFIALALGIKVNLIYFFVFLPIISAITLLPVALGGLGLRENLFVVYFAKAAVGKQLAIAMSLLSFSFIVLYGAIGGLIYVLTVHHRRLQHHQPSGV